jgi:hypothetical protein
VQRRFGSGSALVLDAGRQAITLGEVYGWSPATVIGVLYGLKDLLDGHADTGPIPLSEVRRRLRRRRHSSVSRVAAVLSDLGLLRDDTTAAIRVWVERRTSELPAGFRGDVRAWLFALLDGDARTRPRSDTTVRVYYGVIHPFIESSAATRSHLREITASDVDAVLAPLRGHRRYNAISALRSLFRFAKRRGQVFADPTRHLGGGRQAERIVLPMSDQDIHAIQQAAASPAQRLVVALAAVYAARPKAVRDLTLDDVDLPNRRITIAGHSQPLGDLTHTVLLAWLEHRRATWPCTANRHLLVSRVSALGPEPVAADYLDKHLLPGISLERIRRDRIPNEALATGADPLHLTLVFNIDHTTATAYANAARNLLASPAATALENKFSEACIKRPSEREQVPPGLQVPSEACRRGGPGLRSAP